MDPTGGGWQVGGGSELGLVLSHPGEVVGVGVGCLLGGGLSDNTSLKFEVGCPSCPVNSLAPQAGGGQGRRSSVSQPIGQSSPLAGATGY